jgi:hypothetical protein
LISGRGRELLFKTSRDRLRDGDLRKEVEQELEDLLKNNLGLRALRERRRREEIESRLEDSKPLEKILETLLKQSPTLANLFLFGKHASNPFKQTKKTGDEKPYEGKTYPTFFKFKGKNPGFELIRDAYINMRCRIAFETDAVNDYLSRSADPGKFDLFFALGAERHSAKDIGCASNVNLQNGIASLSLKLPETCQIGDKLQFIVTVTDDTRLDPFENKFTLTIQKPMESSGGNGTRQKPPADESGNLRDAAGGIELPKYKLVKKGEWSNQSPEFDQHTALVIKDSGQGADATSEEPAKVVYDFFINADNVHLQRYLKYELSSENGDKVARTRFELGLILSALALILQDRSCHRETSEQREGEESPPMQPIEDRVANVTKALAPFLLPMIDALGALNDEQVAASSSSGEVT